MSSHPTSGVQCTGHSDKPQRKEPRTDTCFWDTREPHPVECTGGWSGTKVKPLAGCPVLGSSQAIGVTVNVGEVTDTTRHPPGTVAVL